MKHRRSNDTYLLRFETGEEIYAGISQFCKDEGITSGTVLAIGAVADPELGYYHLDRKEYSWKKFAGLFEIVNATGNISMVDGEPFVHLHMTIGDDAFVTHGGHFKWGTAGATCEVAIIPVGGLLERTYDEKAGLKLWSLD